MTIFYLLAQFKLSELPSLLQKVGGMIMLPSKTAYFWPNSAKTDLILYEMSPLRDDVCIIGRFLNICTLSYVVVDKNLSGLNIVYLYHVIYSIQYRFRSSA